MEWWQLLIIVAVGGIILDNMVTNICRAYKCKYIKDIVEEEKPKP